ncbi:MAG: hypothetical protein ACOH1T_09410 [Microbacteriaceae bacterium]
MTVEFVGLIVGGAAVVVFAIAIGRKLIDTRPQPRLTAEQYLTAIEEGDAATANALWNPMTLDRDYLPTRADRSGFTSDAAFAGALERVSGTRIDAVSHSTGSDVAVVFFSYELAGTTYAEQTINLMWDGTRWRVSMGIWELVQIRPVFGGDSSARAGVEVMLGGAHPDRPDIVFGGTFLAYPGVYPLSITAPGWVRDPGSPVTDRVTLAGGSTVVVRPKFVAVG